MVQGNGKGPKREEKNRRWRFGFQYFLISRDSGPYSVVKDVGSQKADITVGGDGAVSSKGVKEGVINT
jgi:hypothetical protein